MPKVPPPRRPGSVSNTASTLCHMGTEALIRGVRLVPAFAGHPGDAPIPAGEAGTPVDVRVADGLIAEIGPRLTRRGEPTYDGGGRPLMPGLWDRHVHMSQWVSGALRLRTSGARDADEACALVREAVAALPPGATLQGFGHRLARWPRPPSVAALDAVSGDHPVILISGDAHHGWLNSAALRLLGLPPRQGVVAEAEWFSLFPRLAELPGAADASEAAYPAVVAAAHALGVVGIGDMEFADNRLAWPARAQGGRATPPVDTIRVRAAVYPADLAGALAAGVRTGDPLPGGHGLVEMGPLKIISDGSLNTRTAWCCAPYADAEETTQAPYGARNLPLPELIDLLRRARAGGLEVAVHAIGDRAVAEALDAFEATGAKGTIEHAQLMRRGDLARMARLGVGASVQPAHLLDDRDVSERCWPDRSDRCFPLRGLRDAGVRLLLGSDAPVAHLDPWLAMAAAVHRSGDERAPWHPEQSLRTAEALQASTNGVRLAVGERADLLLLEADPLAVPDDSREAAAALREVAVAATFVAGRCVYAA